LDILFSAMANIVMSSIKAVTSLNRVRRESMLVKLSAVNILLKKYATEKAK
jgi:hypothetical protein